MRRFFLTRTSFVISLLCCQSLFTLPANAENFPIPKSSQNITQTAEIVKARIHIPEGSGKTASFVTFGQYFKKGDWKNDQSVALYDTNGKLLPTAYEIKKTYSNGDARHAIIIMQLPSDIKNGQYEVSVRRVTKTDTSKNVAITAQSAPDLKLRIYNKSGGLDKTLSLRTFINEQKGAAWFETALATEKRFSAEVTQGLIADFDTRVFADGSSHVDVVFRYDRLQTTPMRPSYYSAEIYDGGKLLQKFSDLEQPHHTAFRTRLKFGYTRENYASLDPYYLHQTGAIPAYDFSKELSSSAIESDYDALKNPDDPAAAARYGLLNPYMPSTGGRPDLGILPKWTVQYLISDDPRARYVMMKHAEIAGRIPWRFFDDKTGEPPLPKDHPNLWIDYRATKEKNGIEPFNPEDKTQSGSSKWIPDTAHQPSLSYIPYLITGDRFFYDNLKAQYFFNKFTIDPNMLEDRAWRTQYVEQVRAYGWIQRTAGQFLNLSPDQDPATEYAKSQFIKDFDFLYDMFINGKYYDKGASAHVTGELKGYLDGWGSDDGRQNPNFMQDLAAMSIAWLGDAGYSPAAKLSAAQVNFIAGRFLQKYNGYDPRYASVYKFNQFIPDDPEGVDTPLGKKKVYSTWKEAFDYSVRSGYFAESRQQIQADGLPGWPRSPDGYVAYTRASTAAIFNTTRDPRAIEAYAFTAPYLDETETGYRENPTFLIKPVFKDGEIMRGDLVSVGGALANTLRAEHNGLLYGAGGDDKLLGGNGEAFLFGGEGDDTLVSGKQGGMLFGDEGADQLISGEGSDYLQGDPRKFSEKDVFIFTGDALGDDIIADFKPGIDKLMFQNSSKIQTYEEINRIYGIPSEKEGDNRASRFYKEANPELTETDPAERKDKTYELLQKTVQGDPEAREKLNLSDSPNRGVLNYIRVSPYGDVIIDLNYNLTDTEKAKLEQTPGKTFGTVRLVGVKPEQLKSSDFLFNEKQ